MNFFVLIFIYLLLLKGKEKSRQTSISFPPSARRMDTLNDLLAASDLVSLHCSLSNDTVQILDAECLQHIKPGTYNTFSLLSLYALVFFDRTVNLDY